MPALVRALTPVMYVRDLEASAAFYRLLGFDVVVHGDDGQWAWSYLRCVEVSLLLAAGDVPPAKDRGPVQLYFQADDVAALQKQIQEPGSGEIPVEHLGYPDHAPGGEIRAVDPDGNVVMVAQTTGAPPVEPSARPDLRTSILQQAAEALRRRGAPTHDCEIGERGGELCPRPADVKLTDSWGDSAWSCLGHADEVLFTVRGVYVASEAGDGLGPYLTRRRRTGS
jgi:catechol 2,3-dioxygenase-like lactoylglutathione lyase family enzyme